MKRHIALVLILMIIFAMLCGCGANGSQSSAGSAPESDKPSASAAESSKPELPESDGPEDSAEPQSMYPLVAEPVELSLWHHFSPALAAAGVMDSYSEHPVFEAAEEATGVHIEFIECHISARAEQFGVMIASNEYPDMFRCFGTLYGSVSRGVEDGIIINFDQYVEQYAPDYINIASTNETWKKDIYEDDGHIAQFKSFVVNGSNDVTNGGMMRGDWLQALGLEVPVTYDEYHDVLTAFKVNYGISDPVMLTRNGTMAGFANGYGTWAYAFSSAGATASQTFFFQRDGRIVSTLVSDEYKQYLTTVNQYYNEGLVSADWITNEENTMSDGYNALITSGQCGMWFQNASFVDSLYAQASDAGFKITPVVGPVVNDSDTNQFTAYNEAVSSNALTISAQCERPELAVGWCNFWFTDLGSSLVDYGVEGVSWELGADGQKHFTELVTKNENMPLTIALNYYALGVEWTGVRSSDYVRLRDIYSDDTCNCIDTWTEWRDDSSTRALPTLSLTAEESQSFNLTYADISTYADECIAKFITGEMTFDQWDEFVENIKGMNIDECVGIYQAALDRYNSK